MMLILPKEDTEPYSTKADAISRYKVSIEMQYKELEEAEKNRKNYIPLEEYGRSRGLE